MNIKLRCGLEIEVCDSSCLPKSGTLLSSLTRNNDEMADAALDAIESLVLAHACEGINVASEEYQKGIESALDAIGNNL